jgi:PD-(D/E)XK nuclease superfamily
MPHTAYIGPDGVAWPSATELTNLLPQAWLWAWFKREVFKERKFKIKKPDSMLFEGKLLEFPQEYRLSSAGRRGWQKCKATSNRGMAIGTEVHSLIEGFIKKETFKVSGKYESELYADHLFDAVNPRVQEWVSIEPHVQHAELKIHGTADAVVRLEDGLAILDWKTSASKSDTHPIQLAVYSMCWNSEHKTHLVDRGIIARIDKKSKKLGVKLDIYENLSQYYPIIKALRLIWEYSNGG